MSYWRFKFNETSGSLSPSILKTLSNTQLSISMLAVPVNITYIGAWYKHLSKWGIIMGGVGIA